MLRRLVVWLREWFDFGGRARMRSRLAQVEAEVRRSDYGSRRTRLPDQRP